MNTVNFQSTYCGKTSKALYRTVGYAYNPAKTERIILFVPIHNYNDCGPFYMNEKDFLEAFEYIGC